MNPGGQDVTLLCMGTGHDHSPEHRHAHPPGHTHGHGHAHSTNQKKLAGALVLAATYMLAEVIGGLWTGSLALLADAGHMLSDVAALGLALLAMWLSKKPATLERTFGYHRAEVLAALTNGLALVFIGAFVIKEALGRWQSPPEVLGGPMLAIAAGGLLVNIAALFILHGGDDENLNVKGAFLHVVADTLGSLGAMTSGALITFFGWRWADPLASFAIAGLVLFSALALLRQTARVLMQEAPAHLNMQEVRAAMVAIEGVCDVHDLHAWTLASGRELLSAHIVLDDGIIWETAIIEVSGLLKARFGLAHVTLQPEGKTGGQNCGCAFASAA